MSFGQYFKVIFKQRRAKLSLHMKKKKKKLTAIKLLLTDPRPFSALLKCSMTSQLDFFGVVVVAVVSELIMGDCNDGTCNSSEICGDRDCRNDVERRAIPLRLVTSLSYNKMNPIK